MIWQYMVMFVRRLWVNSEPGVSGVRFWYSSLKTCIFFIQVQAMGVSIPYSRMKKKQVFRKTAWFWFRFH